jgi:hypothetical protein
MYSEVCCLLLKNEGGVATTSIEKQLLTAFYLDWKSLRTGLFLLVLFLKRGTTSLQCALIAGAL